MKKISKNGAIDQSFSMEKDAPPAAGRGLRRNTGGADMTDRELRKLSRAELLEILLMQGKTVEELQGRVAELEERLREKNLQLANAGSIAEAAMQLEGVFEAAQRSADVYLANVARLNAESQQRREEAEQLYTQTQAKCRELVERTRTSCEAIRRRAGL